jgi:uncharacterized heparinase superfamily protein
MRASHDGYRRLPDAPIHTREIELTATSLIVKDSLSAGEGLTSRIAFHFHPDCVLEQYDRTLVVQSSGGDLVIEAGHPIKVEDAWHCPEFGLRLRSRVAVVEGTDREFRCTLSFESSRD